MRWLLMLSVSLALLLPAAAQAHWRPGVHNHRHAVEKYFGAYADQAWRVALCESDYYPRDGKPDTVARNGQYRGMFQMGSSERQRFGHGPDPWSQARAAAKYFFLSLREVGFPWSPWECKP